MLSRVKSTFYHSIKLRLLKHMVWFLGYVQEPVQAGCRHQHAGPVWQLVRLSLQLSQEEAAHEKSSTFGELLFVQTSWLCILFRSFYLTGKLPFISLILIIFWEIITFGQMVTNRCNLAWVGSHPVVNWGPKCGPHPKMEFTLVANNFWLVWVTANWAK